MVSMAACPTSTSLRSMEQWQTRNLRPPGGDHPAASLRTRSRARRGPRMHHPGRLGERGGAGPQRAAGGLGLETPILSGRGALIGMVAVQGYMVQGYMVQGYIQWTSTEPSGGVMTRLRCGRSSDSDGRSLHIAGLGQSAGPRHSTAPNGVRRGTPAGRGWTGSKAETRGGPGHRAEPDDDPRCAVERLVTISANRQR
jgi:hypothetical protein